MVKINLGGGKKPIDGFLNVDRDRAADVNVGDLETDHLPFQDQEVEEVYSSHFFEHLGDQRHLFRELMRVCREGARVTIIVPHWLSAMALCHGHRCTIAPEQVEHWTGSAVPYWFGGCPRRLRLDKTDFLRGPAFDAWKGVFPGSVAAAGRLYRQGAHATSSP